MNGLIRGKINLKPKEFAGDTGSNLDYSGGRKTHRFPPPYGLGSLSLTHRPTENPTGMTFCLYLTFGRNIYNFQKNILAFKPFFVNIVLVRYGGSRQAVKTSDCGSDMRGFESHLPPHLSKSLRIGGFFVRYNAYNEISIFFRPL